MGPRARPRGQRDAQGAQVRSLLQDYNNPRDGRSEQRIPNRDARPCRSMDSCMIGPVGGVSLGGALKGNCSVTMLKCVALALWSRGRLAQNREPNIAGRSSCSSVSSVTLTVCSSAPNEEGRAHEAVCTGHSLSWQLARAPSCSLSRNLLDHSAATSLGEMLKVNSTLTLIRCEAARASTRHGRSAQPVARTRRSHQTGSQRN